MVFSKKIEHWKGKRLSPKRHFPLIIPLPTYMQGSGQNATNSTDSAPTRLTYQIHVTFYKKAGTTRKGHQNRPGRNNQK
jgi:hypothetical protein